MVERNLLVKGLLGASLFVGLSATGATTASASECVDTDGDGWGWDGQHTCDPSNGCVDTDGDGWGWTGTESCVLSGPSATADPGDLADTPDTNETTDNSDTVDTNETTVNGDTSDTNATTDNGDTPDTNETTDDNNTVDSSDTDDPTHIEGPPPGPVPSPRGKGSGVTVYVVESEIDTSHSAFDDTEFLAPVDVTDPIDEIGVIGANPCGPGHGTMVASTLVSNAPGVTVAPVQVLACENVPTGETRFWLSADEMIDGLEHVLETHKSGNAIANISITAPKVLITDSEQARLGELFGELERNGVLLVVSAGNDGEGACNTLPAGFDNGVTVGGLNESGETYGNFNKGPCVDLYAPATTVVANDVNGGYFDATGTSFSAPAVSGMAAVLWADNPDLTVAQVIENLKLSADEFEEPGLDCEGICLSAQMRPLGTEGFRLNEPTETFRLDVGP